MTDEHSLGMTDEHSLGMTDERSLGMTDEHSFGMTVVRLFEKSWCEIVEILSPGSPAMTARDFIVFILDSGLVEKLEGFLAIVVSDV